MSTLQIANRSFESRLFIGTGKFGNLNEMSAAVSASGSQIITVALKRIDQIAAYYELTAVLNLTKIDLLPNTSGARTAAEAVLAAQLAREALETNWVKLEIHPDPRYLLPDPIETLRATEALAKLDFVVMPYIHADPVLCKRLENAGTAVVKIGRAHV